MMPSVGAFRPSVVRPSVRASNPSGVAIEPGESEATEQIKQRISAMLDVRRRRRLRVQLPLLCAATVCAMTGVAFLVLDNAGQQLGLRRWAISAMLLGYYSAVAAFMDRDVTLLRAILSLTILVELVVLTQQCPIAFSGANLALLATRGGSVAEILEVIAVIVLNTVLATAGCAHFCLLATSLYLGISKHGLVLHSLYRISFIQAAALCSGYLLLVVSGTARTGRPVADVTFIMLESAALSLGSYFWPVYRHRMHALLGDHAKGVTAAAGISELLEGVKAATILANAAKTFYAVRMDELTLEHLVQPAKKTLPSRVTRLGPLHDEPSSPREAVVPADLETPGRASVARPARLGKVDAFISHSWYDDPKAKWQALQLWRDSFVAQHHREPLVWFDSLCIDQNNISSQLPHVPIYLAGCTSLLVLYGPSYLTRLWCLVELFVFHQAHLSDGAATKVKFVLLSTAWDRTPTPVWQSSNALLVRWGSGGIRTLPSTSEDVRGGESGELQSEPDYARALASVETFALRNASSSLEADRLRLFTVIEGSGDLKQFDAWIRALVRAKVGEASRQR